CACRQDMHDQPRYDPYQPSTFFADGRSARPLLDGTIARGQLRQDAGLYTGRTGTGQAAGTLVPQVAQNAANPEQAASAADLVTEFPYPVTAAMLDRGQNRFEIFCTPCHGYTGYGNGMIVQRGFSPAASFHIDR